MDASLLVEDLMEVPNVGIGTVLDLLCVMESTELDSFDLQTKRDNVDSGIETLSAPFQYFRELAIWALSETDSVTLGDAIRYLVSQPSSVEEWRRVSSIELRAMGEPSPHPYHIIDQWATSLPELQKCIFEKRLVTPNYPSSFAELGEQFGYTRERIRQLQILLLNDLRMYMRMSQGKSVGWRIDSMRASFGVAVPERYAMEFLAPPQMGTDYSQLFLYLGGPYLESQGWLVLKRAVKADPTQAILERHTDRFGRVNLDQARQKLSAWGLRSAFQHQWLSRDNNCRWFDDHLVRWNVPIAEKLHYALGSLSAPSTAEELLAYIGERRSVFGAKNVMSVDGRFIRTNKKQWALSEWDWPEYRGIALSIRKMLEDAGESLPIVEVVEKMHTVFGTPKNSANAYCWAPIFVIEGESVRIRRQDESYAYPDIPQGGVPGVFALENDQVGILLAVDRNMLRGSGRAIGGGSPSLLQMIPGRDRTFKGQNDLSIRVTFSETGITGPTLGSMRKIVEALDAKEGDWLTLILSLRQGQMEARATQISRHRRPDWALVERLTGVASRSGLTGLAKALDCDPNRVREVLDLRGDGVVLKAIPAYDPNSPVISEEPVKD